MIQNYDIARMNGSGIAQLIEKHAKKGIRFIRSFEKKVQLHPDVKKGIRACCQNPRFTTALVNNAEYMVIQNPLEEGVERFEFSKNQSPDRLCIIDEHRKCFLYDLSIVT